MWVDAYGKWRWQLLAINGKKIAVSPHGYISKWKCIAAIRLVAAATADAPIWNRRDAIWECD
ncbi:YegP family protein [Stenotrophomonas maltophilia]|uniref:YegP family protein n=1 Tax=Stenotrophomonas maltophilia TaxID=40324 RepID=UPI003D18829C